MPSAVHCRLLGYTATLAVHLYTFHDVQSRLVITTKDPIVADFATLQTKFITIWTFLLQILYALLGLWCELQTFISGEESFLPRSLARVRETLFSALVFPLSLLIPTLFWPLYTYDPNLVFPPFIDKILSRTNNHVMHTLVGFIALYELVFLRRGAPKHGVYLSMLGGFQIVYVFILIQTYIDRGVWIYPILTHIYGTMFFPLFIALVTVLLFLIYYIQWPLTTLVWGKEQKKKKTR